MKKVLLPKEAEKIQNEIFRKMSGEKKLKLAFKINGKILKIARKKMKSRYPNLDPISFSKKLYRHLSLKREFYEDLFNQFLKEELKKFQS
jgi:hypothetical protein